jgi:hypothetical protein
MAFDARTGLTTYNTDDLIGWARLGMFGQKSSVILTALTHLKFYETNYPRLEKALEELRQNMPLGVHVQEIVVNSNENQETTKPQGKPKK